MKNQIRLGSKARCKVTGFTGIVIARLEYINGCIQYGIKPPMDKRTGGMPEAQYVDSEQLEVLGPGISVELDRTGGPSSDAPKHEYRG
jgi:hypothetical protein